MAKGAAAFAEAVAFYFTQGYGAAYAAVYTAAFAAAAAAEMHALSEIAPRMVADA